MLLVSHHTINETAPYRVSLRAACKQSDCFSPEQEQEATLRHDVFESLALSTTTYHENLVNPSDPVVLPAGFEPATSSM